MFVLETMVEMMFEMILTRYYYYYYYETIA